MLGPRNLSAVGGDVMTDQGTWISLACAVATVHAAIGGAPGPVYQTLISICAEGLVRARWTEHASKAQPAIHKRDWIGADIDWTSPSGRIVKADGAGMAGVDFSEDDLKSWIKSLSTDANEATNNEADQVGGDTLVISKPARVQTNKQAALKAKCIDWIRALPPTPPRAKPNVLKDAMDSIPGLSERQAKAAWDDAAPEAWTKPGPK
jgi:hypothetical protein